MKAMSESLEPAANWRTILFYSGDNACSGPKRNWRSALHDASRARPQAKVRQVVECARDSAAFPSHPTIAEKPRLQSRVFAINANGLIDFCLKPASALVFVMRLTVGFGHG
jgi:hypothetical protein